MAKPRFDDPASRPVAQRVMAYVLDVLLRLLHPMMPFLTEEVWQLLGKRRPAARTGNVAFAAAKAWSSPPGPRSIRPGRTRSWRSSLPSFSPCWVPSARFAAARALRRKIPSNLRCSATPKRSNCCNRCSGTFRAWPRRPGRPGASKLNRPLTHAKVSLKGMEVFVDLQDFLDVGAEIERNSKQEQKLLELIGAKEKKLNNDNFVQRAPADVVQRERESLVELQQQLVSTREALRAPSRGARKQRPVPRLGPAPWTIA